MENPRNLGSEEVYHGLGEDRDISPAMELNEESMAEYRAEQPVEAFLGRLKNMEAEMGKEDGSLVKALEQRFDKYKEKLQKKYGDWQREFGYSDKKPPFHEMIRNIKYGWQGRKEYTSGVGPYIPAAFKMAGKVEGAEYGMTYEPWYEQIRRGNEELVKNPGKYREAHKKSDVLDSGFSFDGWNQFSDGMGAKEVSNQEWRGNKDRWDYSITSLDPSDRSEDGGSEIKIYKTDIPGVIIRTYEIGPKSFTDGSTNPEHAPSKRVELYFDDRFVAVVGSEMSGQTVDLMKDKAKGKAKK